MNESINTVSSTKANQIRQIMKEARFARKGDYRTYENYKQQIVDLNLPWDKQDFILRELAKILRV